MRDAARGLIVAALVSIAGASAASADPAYLRAIRSLDGAQFLEDEPVWICDESDPTEAAVRIYRVTGVEEGGRAVRFEMARPFTFAASVDANMGTIKTMPMDSLGVEPHMRSAEFLTLFGLPEPSEMHRLLWSGGLGAGSYEVRRMDADTARVLARFRVVEPRGSEIAVRAGLARAARLAERDDVESRARAGQLVEAVLRRYPNTSYRATAYLRLWWMRDFAESEHDTGAWIDEVFAHFHDSCFGVLALDHFLRRGASDAVRQRLRRVAALYPDTRLARAAARYL